MGKRKETFFIETIKEHMFLDKKFLEMKGGKYQLPVEINPTDGEHNIENCESCKKSHKQLMQDAEEKLNEFPLCCDYHSKLNDLSVFDKNDYKDVSKMVADKIMFCYHHIINNLDNEDWYKDIVDYLEYATDSFGSMPDGCGEPLMFSVFVSELSFKLESIEDKISSDKISNIEVKTRMNKVKKLLEPIPDSNSRSKSDFHILLGTYNDWFKVFPFDLPYFTRLQNKFKKIVPLHTGRSRYNKYLKSTKNELHSKDSLTVVLLDITKQILSSINGLYLYKKKLITDAEKHKLDLIINNRKLELHELSNMPNSSKQEYIKVLKKWYKEEKKFINEITPLLNDKRSTNIVGSRPNRTDIAYCIFYLNETKSLKLNNPFPSEKAWVEIGEKYNKNSKNIQQTYNLISSNKNERLKMTKIRNLEYVIEFMLISKENALKLAKDELNLAQLNS